MYVQRLSVAAAVAAITLVSPFASDAQGADPQLVLALRQAVRDTPDISNKMNEASWLVGMSEPLETRVPDPFYRIALLKTIYTEAVRANLAPEIVLAVIEVESQFDRFAVSRSGARGLMQVMPFWMKEIGHPQDNLFHPRTNLRYGCTILRYYLDLTDGDVREALERYNGSEQKTAYAVKVLEALAETWRPVAASMVSE